MKSYFITDLITKDIDGVYIELTSDFGFYSEKFDCEIWIPKGFISDTESVPILRSKSKRAGITHDYLSRYGASPYVSKAIAAKIYLEAMTTRDRLYYNDAHWRKRLWLWFYRNVKAHIVRWCWGYWKRHKVNATYEELKNA